MGKIKLIMGGFLAMLPILALVSAPASAAVSTVYDAVPNPLPPNVVSLGFQATSTKEFGDYVHLDGTNRNLDTVTVTMSNWALEATPANVTFCTNNPSKCPAGGFIHPITVNIYNVVPGSPNTKGSALGTLTKDVFVPWRPVADPTCPGGTAWRAGDAQCYNGFAFNESFDMSGLNVTLPDDVIVGVAYNTQSYGNSPLGVDGPYNSLNVGIASNQTVSTGTDNDADKVFWDSTFLGRPAGFTEDSDWAPNGTVNIKITADAPATQTLVVSPANQQSWVFNPDPVNATPYEFNTDEFSIGTGSLYVEPISATPAKKFIALKSLNIPATDLNSIAYDFLIAGNGTPASANQFYLNVYTNVPSSATFYDCRFDYAPSTGSTSSFTTANFNPSSTPSQVGDRPDAFVCPATLDGMPAGSTISAFTLNLGDTGVSDSGLAGYFDKVVVSTYSNITTYDFEADTTPPIADLVFPTPGPAATSFQVVFSESVVESEAENPANYFLNNWPGAGGSGDLVGDATVVYDDSTKTATVTFTNPGWYVSAEQEWGVQNIHDFGNNVINPNPTEETSTPMVAPLAPGTPTTTSPTTNTTQTWNWTAATDPGGVDASGVAYYEYQINGGSWVNNGNSLTVNTNLGVGSHTLKVRAVDNAGNVGAESAAGTVTVNTVPPPVVLPTNKEQCMKDGWKTFTNPKFKNQGDCVSFVATKGKNQPANAPTF